VGDAARLAKIAERCQVPFAQARPALFQGVLPDPGRFFGDAAISQLIASDELRPRHKLFRDRQFIDPVAHQYEYSPDGFARCRAAGDSVVYRGVQRVAGPVRDTCLAVARDGWATVHAVAVETPPGVQTLTRHWDVSPVIAVQISGRKRWTVWEPIAEVTDETMAVEVTHERGDGDRFTDAELADMDGAGPFDDVVLEPGDVYVIPAGWVHAPSALGQTSLHVSICPLPQLVVDYFGNEDHVLDQAP
jgi:Cupin superfamily protein